MSKPGGQAGAAEHSCGDARPHQEEVSNPDPLLTAAEAAIFLTISERTVRREIAAGALARTRIGQSLRVRRSALLAYIEEHTT